MKLISGNHIERDVNFQKNPLYIFYNQNIRMILTLKRYKLKNRNKLTFEF